MRRHLLYAAWLGALCAGGLARAETAAADKPIVVFDPEGGFFSSELPHGQAFLIEVPAPYVVSAANLWPGRDCTQTPPTTSAIRSIGSADKDGKRVTRIAIERALSFSTRYCFALQARRGLATAEQTQIQQVFTQILDGQLQHRSRSAAERRQLVAVALGPLGARQSVSGKPIADVVSESIESDGQFQAAWDAAGKLEHDRERAATWWAQLHATGANPTHELEGVFGSPLPADLAGVAGALAPLRAAVPPTMALVDGTPPALTADGRALRQQGEALGNASEPSALTHCAKTALTEQVRALEKQVAAAAAADRKAVQDRLAQARRDLAAVTTAPVIQACATLADLNGAARQLVITIDQAVAHATAVQAARAAALASLPDKVGAIDAHETVTAAVSQPTYTERSALYISADVGVLMPVFLDSSLNTGGTSFATYLGFNVYLAAVDKNVPLSVEDGLAKRFSFVLGLTLDSIADDAHTVDGVFGSKALVTGVGVRLSDYLRLGAGAVWFEQAATNPTVADKPVRATPYLSLSVDLDVAGTLAAIIKRGKP